MSRRFLPIQNGTQVLETSFTHLDAHLILSAYLHDVPLLFAFDTCKSTREGGTGVVTGDRRKGENSPNSPPWILNEHAHGLFVYDLEDNRS